MATIYSLSRDLMQSVCCYLLRDEVAKLRATNHYFREIVTDNAVTFRWLHMKKQPYRTMQPKYKYFKLCKLDHSMRQLLCDPTVDEKSKYFKRSI